MPSEPTPKQPVEKDDAYMRKAYMYTAILLILGLVGGLLLADRIVTAEENHQGEAVEQEVESDGDADVPGDETGPATRE